MKYSYTTQGVCSKQVDFELEGDIVKNVHFSGGCDGNLKAIATLVDGMSAEEITKKLKGVTCGYKSTSCTDQFSKAIEAAISKGNDK